MTAQEKLRLRRQHDNAVLAEEDLRLAVADWRRELEATDPDLEPKKVALLTAQLEGLRGRLSEAQAKADALRVQVRELDVPEHPPAHPGGGAAAMLEADKRPMQWGTGGHISGRDAAWASPEIPGRRTR